MSYNVAMCQKFIRCLAEGACTVGNEELKRKNFGTCHLLCAVN